VQNLVAGLDRSKIVVATQVRRAALDLQEAALRTQTTTHAVTLAEDALSIATERYDAGIAVLVEVTNAQSQLNQARFYYVNAQYDYAVALAQLQRATSSQPELNLLQLLADQGNTTQTNKEVRS
jgi:outer membrane protein TolC